MPTNFPLLRNEPLKDGQASALRTILARDTALQSHLELQRIEMENEASKAQDVASSLVACHGASEQVHEALDALRAAITKSKDLISNSINVHDTEAAAVDKLTTTTAARTAWHNFIPLLEALTPQINTVITSTKSHILSTSDQVCAYDFLAGCTRDSIATLDVSLDAIATSLSIKRRGLSSIFRIPNEVFEIVFQLAVEEERKQLRAEFISSSFSFDSLDDMRRTIPKCPFTLAAVCRGWRNIALDTPKLWSYIRVYTSSRIAIRKAGKRDRRCWVGKAAFETSLQRAKATPLELVIYKDAVDEIQISQHTSSNTRIADIYLVRLASVPRWLPQCTSLYLVGDETRKMGRGDGLTLDRDEIPSFLTGPETILCYNVLPTFPTPLDFTTKLLCFGKHSSQTLDLDQLSEKLPNLEILQLLPLDDSVPSTHSTTTIPRTWNSLRRLIITSPVLSSFAALAQQGLSLPSLTSLNLVGVFASFSPTEGDNIKEVVQTVTSLEIRYISPLIRPTELRVLIDWMEGLQIVKLHRTSVQKTVKALSITPAKPIRRLIIEGTVLKEVGLDDYTALLLDGSDSVSGD